jgi:hypothetical protein
MSQDVMQMQTSHYRGDQSITAQAEELNVLVYAASHQEDTCPMLHP